MAETAHARSKDRGKDTVEERFRAALGRMGKRSERKERQERRNVSFSGAEERVAPFESAVLSFFPSSTWPPCVPAARQCSDCKTRWLTYDSVLIPSEKDGDARVKTGSQLFNSRFAALVSLFRDSSSQQRSMTLFIIRSTPPLPSHYSRHCSFAQGSPTPFPIQLLGNPHYSFFLSICEKS